RAVRGRDVAARDPAAADRRPALRGPAGLSRHPPCRPRARMAARRRRRGQRRAARVSWDRGGFRDLGEVEQRSLSHSGRPVRHVIDETKGPAVTTKSKTITYWGSTALLAFVLLSGGVAYLAHQDDAAAGIAQLGYPSYLLVILGAWKLAG